MHVVIAAPAAVQNGRAFVADAELCTALGAFRYFELVRLIEGGYFDFSAQGGLRDVQRDSAMQIVFVALEKGVRLDLQKDVKISGRTAVGARLAKSYGAEDVFRDVGFEIQPRDRIALVGVNGSGKSTLLRLVAGLEPPDRGTVTFASGARRGCSQAGFGTWEHWCQLSDWCRWDRSPWLIAIRTFR